MKKDLKDLIINIGKVFGGNPGKREPKKGSEDYWETSFAPSRKHSKDHADRLEPLKRYLRKNLGRKFVDVWKDICEVCDNREIRGYHLRQHILYMVDNTGIICESPSDFRRIFKLPMFYVDENGILKHTTHRKNGG